MTKSRKHAVRKRQQYSNALARSEIRWNGMNKILLLLHRGCPEIAPGPKAGWALQQKYGL